MSLANRPSKYHILCFDHSAICTTFVVYCVTSPTPPGNNHGKALQNNSSSLSYSDTAFLDVYGQLMTCFCVLHAVCSTLFTSRSPLDMFSPPNDVPRLPEHISVYSCSFNTLCICSSEGPLSSPMF